MMGATDGLPGPCPEATLPRAHGRCQPGEPLVGETALEQAGHRRIVIDNRYALHDLDWCDSIAPVRPAVVSFSRGARLFAGSRSGDLQPTLRLASARGAQMAQATAAAPELPARDRPLGEMAVLIALFGLLAGLGFFLALATRERPERKEAAALATPLSAAPGGNSASD